MLFFNGELAARRASGFADDEFRLDVNTFGITNLFRIRDSLQQSLRRDFAHSAQRLRAPQKILLPERETLRKF